MQRGSVTVDSTAELSVIKKDYLELRVRKYDCIDNASHTHIIPGLLVSDELEQVQRASREQRECEKPGDSGQVQTV